MLSTERFGNCVDLVVIGGGLSGLTAAALAARAGKSVVLLEKAAQLGGRAATHVHRGAHFNLGAHALYCGGDAMRILRSIGVAVEGAPPALRGAKITLGEQEFLMPRSFWSLLKTRLLSLREKLQLSQFLQQIDTIDARWLDHIELETWFAEQQIHGNLKLLLHTLFRLSTYAADTQGMSAGAAIDQLRVGSKGVLYLHNGWQSLVDGLRKTAEDFGAQVVSGCRVKSLTWARDGVRVEFGSGAVEARHAVLAVAPRAACELLGSRAPDALVGFAAQAVVGRAACLDVAVSKLPCPNRTFTLGLDTKLYYSVHSASARLATPGVHVIHLLKYRTDNDGATAESVERELQEFMEQMQPGWRKYVVHEQYLPNMVATNHVPTAGQGGLQGRPSVDAVANAAVLLAGDWIGSRGMLADASMASAEAAVEKVIGSSRISLQRERVYATN